MAEEHERSLVDQLRSEKPVDLCARYLKSPELAITRTVENADPLAPNGWFCTAG